MHHISRLCLPAFTLPVLALTGLLSAAPALAQTEPAPTDAPQTQTQARAPDSTQAAGTCPPSAKAEPATPETGTTDGTAPENAGSTGWTGGTGGSQIGTNPSGATRATSTWHSPTARGLDLKGTSGPAC